MSQDNTQAREDVVEEFAAAYDGLCEAVAVSAGAIPTPTEGEHNGMPWKVTGRDSGRKLYPDSDVYQFGCWPVLVIETGGYNDVEIIDPYDRRALWIGEVWSARKPDGTLPEGGDEDRSLPDVLRRIADVMEATDFLGERPDQDPSPQGAIAAPDGLGA
jgi:hypothetical protein